ncbi:MAG: hypothetical protein NUV68_08070 [Caldiserica bacterium]|jgi:cytosine permease|nr:hypothetical protein [Caldisericota bacterium]
MKKAKLLNVEEGFTLKPIPPHSRLRWGKLALIYASCMASIPVLLVGFWLAKNYPLKEAIIILFISALIILTFNFANSFLGTDTGLSASLIGRRTFGRLLSKIFVSFPLLLVGWGWFGIQLSLAIKSLLVVLGMESLIKGPNSTMLYLLMTPVIGALFAFTPITHKAAKFGITNLSIFFVSLFCLVSLSFGLYRAFGIGLENLTPPLLKPESPFPLSIGCTVMIGLCASQFVMLSDYSRFSRRVFPDSLLVPLVGVSTPQIIFGGISLLVGLFANFQADFFPALIQAGIPRPVFLLLFFSQWNASRLVVIYSAGLAGASLTENPSQRARWRLTILSVIVATCLVSLGFQEFFLDFLIYQAIVFVPIGTVIFVDHLFSKRDQENELKEGKKAASLFSLLFGLAWGLIGFFYFPSSFFLLGSAISTIITYLLFRRRKKTIQNPSLDQNRNGFPYPPHGNLNFLFFSLSGLVGAYILSFFLNFPFSDLIVLFLIALAVLGIVKYLSQINGLEVEDTGLNAIGILRGEKGNSEENYLQTS